MIDAADTAWLMICSVLVLMMTLPALGLFYAGLVQAKNILSVLMQCLAIACVVSLLWFVIAYSEAFSGAGAFIGNLNAAFLQHAGTRSRSSGLNRARNCLHHVSNDVCDHYSGTDRRGLC